MLQTSGPISLENVAGEFLDSAPYSLNEFYAVDGAPASGPLSLADLYGRRRSWNTSRGTGSSDYTNTCWYYDVYYSTSWYTYVSDRYGNTYQRLTTWYGSYTYYTCSYTWIDYNWNTTYITYNQ